MTQRSLKAAHRSEFKLRSWPLSLSLSLTHTQIELWIKCQAKLSLWSSAKFSVFKRPIERRYCKSRKQFKMSLPQVKETALSGSVKNSNDCCDQEDQAHSTASGPRSLTNCLTHLSPDILQRKYKCFIIYAISIISMIELFLLVFNSDNSSSKGIADILTRYVNRTQQIMWLL